MTIVTVIIGVPIFVSIGFYLYRKLFCQKYFKKLGIPGPEPHWLYGSLNQLWATDDRHLLLQSWTEKYGKFFGYYEGSTPVLVTSNIEAVEQICVKQFNAFPGRRLPPFVPDPRNFPDSPFANIGSLWGDQWKRLRTITNAGFSTGKLKAYSPLIDKSQDELEKLFTEKAASKETFEVFETLQFLALDVISEVAFGVELNSVKNRGANNPILPKFKRLLAIFLAEPFALKVGLAVPEVATIMQQIVVLQMKSSSGVLAPIYSLMHLARNVIAQRRKDPTLRRNDLLQMLIDGTETPAPFKDGTMLKPLSEPEIISQVLQFFGAGTNTTSATLSFAAYVLATCPDCQEKLHDEILTYFPDPTTKPDYDTVMKMPYLDWFIHETVRLYPIGAFVVNRFAAENTELCGIPIVKDLVTVLIDVNSIHHDADLWGPVDPNRFYPERFSPDYPTTATRPGSAFVGFGFGPRICIGMRLALYEMKLTLITLLRRFRVLTPEGGYRSDRLAVKVSTVMLPKDGVWVRLEARA